MRYAHVLSYVARTPWAIAPDKMDEILHVLAFRAAGGLFTAEEIQAQIGTPNQSGPSRDGAIAMVPLRGVIAHRVSGMDEASGGMSAEAFTTTIRALTADASIGTIVLDVDSPGGTVVGVPEAADAVFEARASKRVVAVANGAMASAAYWIASQAQEVVGIPSIFEGLIGSIGVFTVHRDLSAALEQAGIKVEIISAGKHKVDGHELGPLSDERRVEIQAMVDTAYGAFVKAVARGRGVSAADVRTGFGEGRGLSAADAKAAGLIDRIATMDETLARLAGRKGPTGRLAADGAAADDSQTTITPELVAAVDDAIAEADVEADRDYLETLG